MRGDDNIASGTPPRERLGLLARMKLLKELILDCDPQVGVRAVGLQRTLDRAFENKEINQEELNDHETKLDSLMHSFAYDCNCKKKDY